MFDLRHGVMFVVWALGAASDDASTMHQ